jgi:hypothetical protein
MQVVGNNVQPKYDLELYKGFFMEEMTQNLLDFKGRLFFFSNHQIFMRSFNSR